METQKDNTFHFGICMAGAVSAGAYTAGVIDYLLEAMESWYKAKELGLPGIPKHDIHIEVLSGASAGGMTAAITAAAIQKGFPHVNQKNYNAEEAKNNPLFDAWVNLTETPGSDMMDQMLGTGDIVINSKENPNPEAEVRAGFNSSFIDQVASRIIDNIVKDPGVKRPYFAGDLEVLTTFTNLRGYHYHIDFNTELGTREHRMNMHRDFAHFQQSDSGAYSGDGKIPFHFKNEDGLNKELLIESAKATGAFPIGLQPRVLKRDPKYINDNSMLKIGKAEGILVSPDVDYYNVTVDGGVIDNEPFDLTETILANRRKALLAKERGADAAATYKTRRSSKEFDTTILMIDPFPNFDDKPDPNYFPLMAIKFMAGQILGAMRQQLMLKTDELKRANDENDYSRFMIAPIRKSKSKTQQYSIACGSLGGFGGFFNKQFRVHDFMLGRRNCQRFIQRYLSIPVNAGNTIIDFGYEGIEKEYLILSDDNQTFLPIIPDIRIIKNEQTGTYQIIKPDKEEDFPYPSVALSYLLGLEKKMKTRFGAVLSHLMKGKDPLQTTEVNPVIERIRRKSWFMKFLDKHVIKYLLKGVVSLGIFFGKGKAARAFIDAVIKDMEKRGLLKEDV
ncbi:MAG: patatin-like phospholipase family protein [Bacteroidetes bacterium]|nr:patatin-like phospholipase family protein [Bacteroidota bacterium]